MDYCACIVIEERQHEQPEQLEERQPEPLKEQLPEVQPEHREQLEERQPEQLAESEQTTEDREPEQLEERWQTEQMMGRLTGELVEQVIEGKREHSLEQIVTQPEQLGSERQPEKQLVERSQPARRVQPMAVERQFKQPVKRSRPLEERLYIEEGLKGRPINGNWSKQKMEMVFDPSDHEAMKKEIQLLAELEHQAKEGIRAPMLKLVLLLPERNQNYRQIEGTIVQSITVQWPFTLHSPLLKSLSKGFISNRSNVGVIICNHGESNTPHLNGA